MNRFRLSSKPFFFLLSHVLVLRVSYTVSEPQNATPALESPLSTHRTRAAQLYLVGGGDIAGGVTTTVDVFDFESSTWRHTTDFPVSELYLGAAALSGRVYAVGGSPFRSVVSLASTYVYNLTTILSWWRPAPSMTTKRGGLGVAALGGKIYAVGGYTDNRALGSTESFDQVQNKWTPIANMSQARAFVAAAVMGDKLYAIGGTFDTPAFATVEAYEPKANNWSAVAPMKTGRWGASAVAVGEKLYVVGGQDLTKLYKSAEVYDPKLGEWSDIAEMSAARVYAGAVAVNGEIYVVGGYDGSNCLDTMEVYNPGANSWRIFPARLPVGRAGHAVALVLKTLEE